MSGSLHSIEQFSSIIRNNTSCLLQSESLPLEQCINRISAESLVAPFDMPEFPTSAMDGYALSASDWHRDKFFEVSQRIMADTIPTAHKPNTIARVFTGGSLPPGVDCVVMQEKSKVDNGLVRLDESVVAGQNIRPAASIFSKEQELFAKGSLIKTPQIALAAMSGKSHISVVRKIRVCVLALGDELIPSGDNPATGKIYDSNSVMIASLLQNHGCVVKTRIIADDRDLIRDCIMDAATTSDLIISLGGASVGERDYVGSVIYDAGKIHAWKVSVKPGKPILFGCVYADNRRVPFFGLPGNPSSSLITFVIFVRLAIYKILGLDNYEVPCYRLAVTNSHDNPGKRDQFVYCRRYSDGIKINAQQDSASLIPASMATGVCHIKPYTKVLSGDIVDYYPFSDLFSL